ncbi:MAG: NADH:ubiquinone oxidoreductase subunit 6 (subunit J) [Alphaproteobacteria bacterium]|jgi:NADH:ubiquinone oxidoreductase subunit 6 (subunit J)
MQAALPFLIAAAAISVLVVLVIGIINMLRKDHNPRTSNKLMRWRVGLQLGAVLLLLLLLMLSKG